MTGLQVLSRTRAAAKAASLPYAVVRQRGSHRQVRVGQCATTVQMDRRDMPTGTLHKIEADLEPCLGTRWLTR